MSVSIAFATTIRQLGGSTQDPQTPEGRLLFNVLAMVAEFESDLIKMRTRERPMKQGEHGV
jgi:DNA invertase Pin-like site-specific DNA recombinase